MIKNLSPNAGVSRAGGYGVISPECRQPVQEVVESVVYIGKAHLPDPGSPSRTIKAADVKASGYRKKRCSQCKLFPERMSEGCREPGRYQNTQNKIFAAILSCSNFLEVTFKGMEGIHYSV